MFYRLSDLILPLYKGRKGFNRNTCVFPEAYWSSEYESSKFSWQSLCCFWINGRLPECSRLNCRSLKFSKYLLKADFFVRFSGFIFIFYLACSVTFVCYRLWCDALLRHCVDFEDVGLIALKLTTLLFTLRSLRPLVF